MPHKFNDARRDKFAKAKYRITNCSEYNESLRQRGDVTIWVSDDVVKKRASPRRKTRSGQARYSELAIEIALLCGSCFDFRSGSLRASCGRLPS